jgi:hypothetical protein
MFKEMPKPVSFFILLNIIGEATHEIEVFRNVFTKRAGELLTKKQENHVRRKTTASSTLGMHRMDRSGV